MQVGGERQVQDVLQGQGGGERGRPGSSHEEAHQASGVASRTGAKARSWKSKLKYLPAVMADNFQAAFAEENVATAAASLRVPTLLFSGGLSPYVTQRIVQRLLEPMSRWVAVGSTLQVNIRKELREGEDSVAQIHFEARNCEPAKAMQDCVLFAPALQVVPKRASEFLKASLAIGHMGGTISSPPARVKGSTASPA